MFTRKSLVTAGLLSVVALVLVAVIATNLIRGHRKKIEDQRIAELVADGTAQLREALGPNAPSAALVAKLDAYARTAQSSPNPEMGSAAQAYLLGAREIARQRGNSERLTREAAVARNALGSHMARAERRNTNWIKNAAELKRRVETVHAELDRSYKVLDGLLYNLPDVEKRLAPHVVGATLLDPGEIDAARKRLEEDSKRATAALEQVRRIVP
jgi:hypothetical protein